MRNLKTGVMLFLLTSIATMFAASCTQNSSSGYGPSAPQFQTEDSVQVCITVPNQLPYGILTLTVRDQAGNTTEYKAQKLFDDYRAYINTYASTVSVTVEYWANGYPTRKVVHSSYELKRGIQL